MHGMDERARLGSLIKERRQGLGLTMTKAAAVAGIDRNTWSTGEAGTRRIADSNFAGIERALGWAPGSIADVLAGGDPTCQAQPESSLSDLGLDAQVTAEIERIKGLSWLSTEQKLSMIRAVIDVAVEEEEARAAAARREDEQRKAG